MEKESHPVTQELVKRQTASDHLANERTLLAWIRTGIGIMAFGFVVVKFSLFIRQISIVLGKQAEIRQYGYSGPIGILLVAVGAVSLVFSIIRYNKTRRQLISGEYLHKASLLYILVIFLLLISIILIVYLIRTT